MRALLLVSVLLAPFLLPVAAAGPGQSLPACPSWVVPQPTPSPAPPVSVPFCMYHDVMLNVNVPVCFEIDPFTVLPIGIYEC
jgi:hypothetical protein